MLFYQNKSWRRIQEFDIYIFNAPFSSYHSQAISFLDDAHQRNACGHYDFLSHAFSAISFRCEISFSASASFPYSILPYFLFRTAISMTWYLFRLLSEAAPTSPVDALGYASISSRQNFPDDNASSTLAHAHGMLKLQAHSLSLHTRQYARCLVLHAIATITIIVYTIAFYWIYRSPGDS